MEGSIIKPTQILVIDPPVELRFKGPFTDVVSSHIKLTNPSSKQVCFKVKTTAPKQYCVRPNSGIIPPNETMNVSVMLQPFDFIAEERNKHKFMVQSAFIPENEHSLDNIWKNTPPGEMMDSKLRVVFDLPAEQAKSIVTDKTSMVKSQFASAAAASPVAQNTHSIESEFRRIADENKRHVHNMAQLEHENFQLRERLRKLDSTTSSGGSILPSTVDHSNRAEFIRLLVVLLVAIIIGLFLGRSF